MSIFSPPRQSRGIKFAYITLLVASIIATVAMLKDLLPGQQIAATGASPSLKAPVSVSTTESSTPRRSLDPGIEHRIREILGQAPVEDTNSKLNPPTEDSGASDEDDDVQTPLQETVTKTDVSEHSPPSSIRAAEAPTTEKTLMTAAIRQETQLHDKMLTPGNFEYVGAFRPPIVHNLASKFSYGGWALAYREDGDPDGPDDGFPGSLFIVGHRLEELVAEIDIPRPAISERKSLDDLQVCKVLQPFADITSGMRTEMTAGSSEPFQIGGLQVLDNRLHWSIYKYYNIEGHDYHSHGTSSLDLSRPDTRGIWHLGPANTSDPQWHSYKSAGYIFDIPTAIADQYFGGRNLISGLQISTGLQHSSQGPPFYAFKVPKPAPGPGANLDTVPLIWYPLDQPVMGHHYADRWTGAAWVSVGNKHSVIAFGRKAHGPVHYGLPRPGDCYQDKGYHGSSYEAQALFYSPNQLLETARSATAASQPWYRWDSNTPGGGLNRFMFQDCGKEIGGVAYDRTRNLLYIVEVAAGYAAENEWEVLPVVHVMRIVAR